MKNMRFLKFETILSKSFPIFLKKFGTAIDPFLLKNLIDLMFTSVEKIIIKNIKLVQLYIKYYEDIIDEEISMANIDNNDKFLHLGCGSIPSTSILVAHKTGAIVTGIDKNIHTVKEARSCINMINHSDSRIQFKQAEALNFSIENFDVITVSQGIEPRREILEYISQHVKDGVRVILRTNSSAKGELTHHDMFLKKYFKISKIVSHEKHGLLISVMLFKK